MPVVVRHHGMFHAPRANLAAADDERDVEALFGHRRQARLQLEPFG
jgi:hypothetical protein